MTSSLRTHADEYRSTLVPGGGEGRLSVTGARCADLDQRLGEPSLGEGLSKASGAARQRVDDRAKAVTNSGCEALFSPSVSGCSNLRTLMSLALLRLKFNLAANLSWKRVPGPARFLHPENVAA